MTSIAFEKARKFKDVLMAGGVALTFPAFDDLPEKKLFLGTRNLEGDDGENYQRSLPEMPFLRSQSGIGNDSLDFAINDPESFWYEQIKNYEDVLVDTEVVSREFLKTERGIFESEIIFNGFLQAMSLDESKLQIPFSAISDMSRSGFLVGGRILTQRYCAAKFNKNGLKNPLFDACGWTTAQGGNPLFCTHKLKGADGCADHFNDWRLLAVEALSTAEITTVTGNSGGWGYGSCFTPQTRIWMADGSTKPIYQIKKGDAVMSYTKTEKLVKRKVKETARHIIDNVIVFDFGFGREMNVTTEHLLTVGKDAFRPAGSLDSGDTLRANFPIGGWKDLMIRNNYLKEIRTAVHNFSVWGTGTYFVVLDDDIRVAVHNAKYPGDLL